MRLRAIDLLWFLRLRLRAGDNMHGKADHTRAGDPGLLALVVLLRFLGVRVDLDRVRERFGKEPIAEPDKGLCEIVRSFSCGQVMHQRHFGVAGLLFPVYHTPSKTTA
jgi:hypothetical protein